MRGNQEQILRPMMPSNYKIYLASLGAVFAAFILATFLRWPSAWGINFLKFYPVSVGIITLSIFVLLAVPAFSRHTFQYLSQLSHRLNGRKYLRGFLLALFVMVSLSVFYLFRAATAFLGDGQLRLNEISMGHTILPTELLDFLLHAFLFQQILLPYALKPVVGYQIISVVSGALFIYGIYRLARYLFPGSFLVWFMTLLSSGILVLFFGYVESYSIIAALLPFVFLEGLKAAKNPHRRGIFLLIYLLSGLVHSIALILFAPALLFIFMGKAEMRDDRNIKIDRLLIIGCFILLIVIVIARYIPPLGLSKYLLPIFPEPASPQAVFTLRHITNLINWILLTALPIVVMMPDLISKWRLQTTRSIETRFALWTAAPALLFLLVVTPQLGGPRDWDLFALPVFVLLMSSVTAYSDIKEPKIQLAILPAAFLSFILTFAFAGINHSIPMSSERFAEIIRVQKFRDLYIEYNLLAGYAGKYDTLKNHQLEFTLKSWEEGPHTRNDTVRTLLKLDAAFLALAKNDTVPPLFWRSDRNDSLNLLALQYLTDHYRLLGKSSGLAEIASASERIFKSHARGQLQTGLLYSEIGDTTRAQESVRRAYNLDSSDFFILVNYGAMQLRRARFSEAVRPFERAIEMDPDNFAATFNLALAYKGTGAAALAAEFLVRAQLLAVTPQDSARIAAFENETRAEKEIPAD
ncbi:membrane hypothetical protein [Candidatus Zixiibacteriota bacterium]|nr:membrane hypothetical protein [candidate division Zixibacteria bacterium]